MIKSEIVAHSLSLQGDELISVLCTFPRIILAEVNTHRMLSKNTSSSRAIPFNKMVESVQNDPFIPIAWQKEHKGMQGSEYFTDEKDIYRRHGELPDIHLAFCGLVRNLPFHILLEAEIRKENGEVYKLYNPRRSRSLSDTYSPARVQ